MAWAGAGQSERTSAGWSNQPTPTGNNPAEFGPTTYTTGGLGLASKTDSTGTTSYTRDPSGLPVAERTPTGTYYYVFDGLGNVVMLVDPPSGSPAAIIDTCPTGNDAGGSWEPTGSRLLDQNLILAVDLVAHDAGTKLDLTGFGFRDTNSGNGTQSCADPSSPWYCAIVNPILGPGGLLSILPGLFHGQGEGGGGASEAPRSSGNQGVITGFTRHGMNQVIQRGVRLYEILDAVRNPVRVVQRANGIVQYVGRWADIRLNQAGEVVTAIRFKPPWAP